MVNLVTVAVIWGVVPLIVIREREPGSSIPVFGIVLIGLGIMEIFWVLFFKRLARQRAAGAKSVDELLSRIAMPSLVAAEMAVTPAILGLVLYLTTGNRSGLALLCALSLAALFLTRPRPEEWRDISPSGGWTL